MEPEAFRHSTSGSVVKTRTGYWAYVPNPLPPLVVWSPSLVQALSEADRALGELSGLSRLVPNPHLLIRPFLRREAVLSSRIEGTQATLTELYAFEAGQPPRTGLPDDVAEVHNYVRALEYGRTRCDTLPMSLRLLRELHAILVEGVRGEHLTPGEFRRSQNWIGPPGCLLNEATYVPPPPEEMRQALAAFEAYLHAEPDLPPLVRLGLIHYQFEAIHPFLDGNGRIGRLLIVLLLCMWELLPEPLLYLSAYFEAHRQAYYDLLLAVSQRGTWEEWLTFFLRGVESQARDAALRARGLVDLRDAYRARLQQEAAAARLLMLIDLLFRRPVLTVANAAEELDVQPHVAARYIVRLEQEGILREVTGQRRNRVYHADEILRAIQDPVTTEDDRRTT